jgi:hypothetical protein
MEVKKLIQAKEDSASVAYQTFVLLTSSSPNALFCFFEGKDAPYYHLRIKSNYHGEFHYIKCGGKSKVKKVNELIKSHPQYKKFKKAFFVDRDFDKSIKDKLAEIYETPCYSIENLYCSKISLIELLKTDFQLTENSQEFKTILPIYDKLIKEFLEASLMFNAWYKLQKEKQEDTMTPNNVNLSESLIPDMIKVNLTAIIKDYDLNKILLKYPNSIPIANDELESKINELSKSDLAMSLRGKYILNFFIGFIRLLLSDANDPAKRTILTQKIKYNLDNSTALTMLTTYAASPTCLIDFIKQFN